MLLLMLDLGKKLGSVLLNSRSMSGHEPRYNALGWHGVGWCRRRDRASMVRQRGVCTWRRNRGTRIVVGMTTGVESDFGIYTKETFGHDG